ncbi:MAG: hypothetical protein AAF604_20835 [Acidobacteriota bacterium]
MSIPRSRFSSLFGRCQRPAHRRPDPDRPAPGRPAPGRPAPGRYLAGAPLLLAIAAVLVLGAPRGAAAAEPTIHRLQPTAALGSTTFDGDIYSFEHQLGALIDEVFRCLSPHTSGTDDNQVLFDGLSEFLDPYVNGTAPFVFESETGPGPDGSTVTTITSAGDDDLFPEGFTDPDTGTPLDAACVEIGISDTLDSQFPVTVTQATLEFLDSDTSVLGPLDITDFFGDPWDGRLSLGISTFAGRDIDTVELKLTTAPSTGDIFADGFESGDATSWTSSVP